VYLILIIYNNGSALLFQDRPGKSEKIFTVIKFKTMSDKKDSDGNLLLDNIRLTKFGFLVRKTSLDEISQLLNVLIGDMSLIGPRSLLTPYLSLYNIEKKKRHNVKPGITGWAQVNGGNAIICQKKFEFDVRYEENISMLTDIKIFFKTFLKVFKRAGEATTIILKGNE
jgi:lipopolysaccharide/colanic/teichoic acid biosynthesis glycosyltransferase